MCFFFVFRYVQYDTLLYYMFFFSRAIPTEGSSRRFCIINRVYMVLSTSVHPHTRVCLFRILSGHDRSGAAQHRPTDCCCCWLVVSPDRCSVQRIHVRRVCTYVRLVGCPFAVLYVHIIHASSRGTSYIVLLLLLRCWHLSIVLFSSIEPSSRALEP